MNKDIVIETAKRHTCFYVYDGDGIRNTARARWMGASGIRQGAEPLFTSQEADTIEHIWHQVLALLAIALFMACWAVQSYKKNS